MKPLDHHQVAFQPRRSSATVQSFDEIRAGGAASWGRDIKRIALFSGNFNYLVDGAAKALNRLVAHLETRGIEVMIFSPTTDAPAFPAVGRLVSAPSVPLPGRGEYRLALGLTPRLRRRLESFQPDLIHVSAPDLLGNAALSYARRNGIPSIASFHTRYDTYFSYYRLGWLARPVTRYLRHFYRKADRILAPSEDVAAWLKARGMARSIGRWERGVDRTQFSPQRRSLEWRRSLGIADEETVILFVGRLVLEKGLEQFARVIRRLENRAAPHRVLVVGDGPARDDFESWVPDALFTGYLGGEDLARAYASADILFNPSVTEAFPNVILEAMASGVPGVCADTTGARTLVDNGHTGILVDAIDDAAYAQSLRDLIDDPGAREQMAAACQDVASRYSWEAVLDEVIFNYASLIGAADAADADTAEDDVRPALAAGE